MAPMLAGVALVLDMCLSAGKSLLHFTTICQREIVGIDLQIRPFQRTVWQGLAASFWVWDVRDSPQS